MMQAEQTVHDYVRDEALKGRIVTQDDVERAFNQQRVFDTLWRKANPPPHPCDVPLRPWLMNTTTISSCLLKWRQEAHSMRVVVQPRGK